MFTIRVSGFALLAVGMLLSQTPAGNSFDPAVFKDPPAEFRGHAMWGFNLSTATPETIISGVRDMIEKQHLGGFFIEPTGGNTRNVAPAFLQANGRKPDENGAELHSPEFYKLYRVALEEAKKQGAGVLLYDDWSFPTGTVGGLFYTKYPQYCAKSLEMVEKDAVGPAKVELVIPEGIYVGAVMMNRDTYQRVDVSGQKNARNMLVCQVPRGNWKVMGFYLDPGATLKQVWRKVGFVDYLDEKAMDAFISMSYDKFYANLKDYFGTTIKMTFYDEPAMHLTNGRMWTPGFNQGFQKKYGFSPMSYYPALWYDIGPETAAARNALWGYRAQLYADGFVRKLANWCEAHGILFSGHQDQEEARNPVAISGDLMKVFEHQQVPGHDDIYYTGRSNVSYKIVTSASYNYDRPVTMAETYAAYRGITDQLAFKTAMDQFAMGINFQVPARARITKAVELNTYVGRMSYLLQHGRHVADIAVLYPIAALQAAYKNAGGFRRTPVRGSETETVDGMSVFYALEGGAARTEIDYMDLGEMLYRGLRVDYTYLHPEVLESRCLVEKQKLILNNKENREEFSVLILPGGDTISAAVARKVLEFYRSGGTVIATSQLPYKSAEFRRDREVQEMTAEVFGVPLDGPVTAEIRPVYDDFKIYFANSSKAGGKSYFIPKADPALLNTGLKESMALRDVDIQEAPMWPVKVGTAYDGALTYLHKVRDGRDIYFFANSQDRAVDTKVVLRGKKNLRVWNPHSGELQAAQFTQGEAGGQPVTTVRLQLAPVTSVFYVQE